MIWKTSVGGCIYQIDNIKVHQNLAFRWLTLGSDAIQTLVYRYNPEQFGLTYIPVLTVAVKAIPASACLLGLGGAGVAHALRSYLKNIKLDAVEKNANIIAIANRYFMTCELNYLNIIHEDANHFVRNTANRYKHLMVDLFNADSFPAECRHADFFYHCHRALLPEGVLAVNLANLTEQWPLFLAIREHFQQFTLSIPIKDSANIIILAYKNNTIQSFLNLIRHHLRLKRIVWDSMWGWVAYL